LLDRQSDPAHCQAASELTMGEQRDVPAQTAEPGDQAIGTVRHVARTFAIRAAIAVAVPASPLLSDVAGDLALVLPVVPFGQIRFDFRQWQARARQFTGSPRPQRRTGEHEVEADGAEQRFERAGLRLTVRRQGNISASGVLAGQRPRRLAMPDQMEPQALVNR
jgi:hypothetical protein